MKAAEVSEVLLALEDGINRYVLSRRNRVDEFVTRHYSARESLELHRRWLLYELLCYPINALWALPYLFLKKCCETLDVLGFTGLQRAFARLPARAKTPYQRTVESLIESELLEWPRALFDTLHSDHRLASLMDSDMPSGDGIFSTAPVRSLLEKHSAYRAVVADLSGTAGTMLVGWLVFHNQFMTIAEVGNRLASERAEDRSVSHFLLGNKLSQAWYTIAPPPKPTLVDVVIGLGAAIFFVVGMCFAISLVADPLRKAFGLQQKSLNAFIDQLEEHLRLEAGKVARKLLVDSSLSASTPSPVVSTP